MDTKHIHTRFDKDLQRIEKLVVEMADLVGTQMTLATQSMQNQDEGLARTLIPDDDTVNRLEAKIDQYAVRLIALRQPMAEDLRQAIAPIKISSDLERIGDHAKAIAVRQIKLSKLDMTLPSMKPLIRMSRITQEMLANVVQAYVNKDVKAAMAVYKRDSDVDEMNASLFRELLTYMMGDPRQIESCMHLLFIARSFERIGDHVCNIAEQVYYLVNGELFEEEVDSDGA